MRTRRDPKPVKFSRFRRAAHAWFVGAPRRLALARLHGQMAVLAQAEVDVITRSYDWPPRPPLSPEELVEVEHLRAIGDSAAERMASLAPGRPRAEGFYDFIFDRSEP